MSNASPPQGAAPSATGSHQNHRSTTPPHIQGKHEPRATSLRPKVSAYEVFSGTKDDLKKTRERILNETAGHFLGPMPVKEFFDEFMPWNEGVPDAYKKIMPPKKRVKQIVGLPHCTETEVYSQFVNAFKGWNGLLDPKGTPNSHLLRFTDSHKHCDKGCRSYSVDISIYAETLIPRKERAIMDFANVHCWVEIKPKSEFDAFDDGEKTESVDEEKENSEEEDIDDIDDDDDDVPFDDGENDSADKDKEYGKNDDIEMEGKDMDEITLDIVSNSQQDYEDEQPDRQEDIQCFIRFPFENSSISACNTRAQLAGYAAAVMATQYRQHFISVLIAGDRARFIRWDRSAAVVTKAFNITRQPRFLFEFFKRFRQLSFEQRGCNPDVQPASKREAVIARKKLCAIAPELWLGVAGEMFLKDIDIDTQPFLKIKFSDQTFIVPAPYLHERGLLPFGRATRSSAAILLKSSFDESVVCYLKDAWRVTARPSEPEVYNRLVQHQVSHIATMLYGGDLPYTTDSNKYKYKSWIRKANGAHEIRQLTACLIVLKEVGRSLMAFRKTHQLVGGLADGMQAYEDALKKAKVMHRDISVNNILLVKTESREWRGILIDWDHSVFIPVTGTTSEWHTGTWPFMSIKLLGNPKAPHTELDDRESAVYVLLWIALRHLKIGSSPGLSLSRMIKTFDQHQWDDEIGAFVGGSDKFILLFTLAEEPIEFPKISLDPSSNAQVESPMTNLVKILATPFSLLYQKNELIKSMFADLLQKTVENPDWLISQLRQASDSLKKDTNSDPDWVNNVRDRLSSIEVDQPEWHQSKFYIGYTTAEGRNKRPLVYPEIDAEDKEPRKRSKLSYPT